MRLDRLHLQAGVIARDLRLDEGDDPLAAIIAFCDRKARSFLRQLSCNSLPTLLDLVANKLGTRFIEIHTDSDLARVVADFRARRETGFADIERQIGKDVLGVTIRLQQRLPGELAFVSIIDCRGEKAARRYFTKWHEVAHLFILTDQARLQVFRTHAERKVPEEQIVDKIAGHFSFYQPFIADRLRGELTFELIDSIHQECCPDASRQSAMIGIASAWQAPTLVIHAALALKKEEQRLRSAGQTSFLGESAGELRAVSVVSNAAARAASLRIFENMRVPKKSVIHRMFTGGATTDTAVEDLSWWQSSTGGALAPYVVRVQARTAYDGVDALICAAN
jgi:hypothetical protein